MCLNAGENKMLTIQIITGFFFARRGAPLQGAKLFVFTNATNRPPLQGEKSVLINKIYEIAAANETIPLAKKFAPKLMGTIQIVTFFLPQGDLL